MSSRHGIYISSKVRHAAAWQILREEGWPIISTWIDDPVPTNEAEWHDLWDRCLTESTQCKVFIQYADAGEVLKGALVELGAALSHNVRCLYVGPIGAQTVYFHPSIRWCADLPTALAIAKEILGT